MLPVSVLETSGGFRRFDIIWQAIPAINNTNAEEFAPVFMVPTLWQ
jgi:hypothetical protein